MNIITVFFISLFVGLPLLFLELLLTCVFCILVMILMEPSLQGAVLQQVKQVLGMTLVDYFMSLKSSDLIILITGLLLFYGITALSLAMLFQNQILMIKQHRQHKIQKRELLIREKQVQMSNKPMLSVEQFTFDVLEKGKDLCDFCIKHNSLDMKNNKLYDSEQWQCTRNIPNAHAILFTVGFRIKDNDIDSISGRTFIAKKPYFYYMNTRSSAELVAQFTINNWRRRKKTINNRIAEANNSIPEFQALATRYMVNITNIDLLEGDTIQYTYVVEQGTHIYYNIPIKYKNLYGHEFVQNVTIDMALNNEKWNVMFEISKGYSYNVLGNLYNDIFLIQEDIIDDFKA